ncbi:cytochrome P450 [Xenorhabdus bovienii]|uniref:Putative cytochrome P450 oxidoreductase n=1 Tax=Xenorhabdus bovienii str. kraussei Quebec TaxID=1398203 RepID=A0A077P8Z1_XENBV|nr:cytochrome P450 [Xenorhabdus bovienii]MDE9565822.1 cytochrome P450 [Xenorhabdus bovienii]CDH20930.1 putative cytochrome P450 oxidoreductase [Xenorhabdus bovienii str. kraussei Quebec]
MTIVPAMNPLRAIQLDDPYPYYAELTRERPFYFDSELKLWVAADAASVRAVLAAPHMQVRPSAQPIPSGIVDTPAGEIFRQLVRMRENEYQQRIKSVIIQALSSADLQQVRRLAMELAVMQLRQGTELNAWLFSVPASVVATLCGFIPEEVPDIVALIAEFVLCIPATANAEQQARASKAAEQLLAYFGKEIEKARQGTLLSALLQTAVSQEWTQRAPLIANAIGFLSQTYDATAGLIGNALLAAQRYPKIQLADACPEFVKEVSRFDASIQNTRRFATEAFAYCGHVVEPGQTVLLLFAAANRDPAINTYPQEFILDRAEATSFSFSDGRHRCPGASLAQAITCGMLDAMQRYNPEAIGQVQHTGYLPSGNARIPELIL